MSEKLFKVGSSTDSTKLANSIFAAYSENKEGKFIIRAIGAGALNQAVKAQIIANREFSKKGLISTFLPYFQDIEDVTGKKVTAIEMQLELRRI